MQLTMIEVYEICPTFPTVALLLAQRLLKCLISLPLHRTVRLLEGFFAHLCRAVTRHTCDFVTVKSLQLHSGVHLFHGEGSYCPCHYSLK